MMACADVDTWLSAASTATIDGTTMTVLDDNAIFIERAINNVKEHAMIGGFLVILIIFAFLRDFRSTLIVCTSIPIAFSHTGKNGR